ncbi:ATP-binding response regulator [Alloalcanivorax mobilis]|uniref:ATP-binding response regulator n=1 Tax=Alloalcanivorax mobilis TaxID=2019569 RepID=UPI000C77B3E6|nr:hybrid sensor histidine kinase/response regulator [Alloalcanivorax mobilis]
MNNAATMPPGVEGAELEARITHEAISRFMGMSGGGLLAKVAVVLMVAVAHYQRVPSFWLLGWGIAMLAGVVYQSGLAKRYQSRRVGYREVAPWQRRLIFSRLYLGALWGGAFCLMYPYGTTEHHIFVITIALVLAIGNVVPAHYCKPLFAVYAGPILLGLALALAFAAQAQPLYWLLALSMGWVFLAGVRFARILNRSLREQIRLRYESHAMSLALEAKSGEAQRATLAKSRFLAAASHDLRQPLHALSLFVGVLKETRDEAEREALFERVQMSLEALCKLFDALLDVSRLDANAVEPEYSAFDVPAMLTTLAAEFEQAAAAKGIRLTVHARPVVADCDRLLLERVLRNLVGNAVRYTHSGGILITARQRAGRILLQVWDTGEGIDAAHHEDIFMEFLQLGNPHRDRAQGLGLGLALVRRLCDLLALPLTLASVPGRGSVFGVSVARGDPARVVEQVAGSGGHSWDLSGRNVVVIDDEQEILDAMQTMLGKWGCRVIVAESVMAALTRLRQSALSPELVLSDLRLRDGDSGIAAINTLRRHFGEALPGVLITGDTDARVLREARASGYEVLQKPLRPAQLRTVIHDYLPRGPASG